MGAADFGSAKYLNKKMKARGLQKLRFYCQTCQKQCRDENGFKSHCRSPFHVRNTAQLKPQDVANYTEQFEKDFLRLLRLSHGEKKIEANKFYNEFIQDRDHIHMNATSFHSLTRFILHLGKTGKIRIHGLNDASEDQEDIDMESGKILISYIDDSFENMLRNDRVSELEKSESSEQDIKTKMLKDQIALAGTHPTDGNEEEEEEGDAETTSDVNYPIGKISLKISRPSHPGKVTKKKKNLFKSLKK
ncbi:LADA_0A01112g1_1 [Lachancea dasiensis]|uniref:LADA_0A01112g1_1 n=1 Tax=Lachancea dasiensis TaxID=1072105 RepID=A0A1G4IMF6_9SACH|nr:LADA_0A01112g1_1 [Lachancea dasiensis]